MKKQLMIILLSLCLTFSNALSGDKGTYSINPKAKPDGKKWRIGCYESGPYKDYLSTLTAIVHELAELGWIEKTNIPTQESPEDTSKLWKWLSTDIKSKYLEFVSDAYWSSKFDKTLRESNKKIIIERLSQKKDIDLMFAFGTIAGQDLANNNHSVPSLVCSVSDAIGSKIVKSVTDSGFDHVHARLAPERYERQINMFHKIVGFKKLGVAFENSPDGRNIAAVDKIEKVAKEKGFEIIPCYSKNITPDKKEAEESLYKCLNELAPKIDAFYITLQRGVSLKTLPQILEILNKYKIPTFSQSGSEEVKYGVLMSMSRKTFNDVGRFEAETMAKIFNGAKPRDLNQVFENPLKIALNLKEAEIIGWKAPMDMFEIAEEVYKEIQIAK
ncbi:MAG: ABC transporter substrate-binding protein [Desulfobacterales bacterium]|nr:ABC transporter substrate-binding protein [Desulfobacterales bacterium]MBF0397091.1 ABC transporter substrate-binding protein [Desulfobacterales bacterium]